ncbi:AAA family ATPase [Cetobacterium sp.]|uniref:AAA family ATPase n=1 Tax=Cetobacterium sp. TaxID=2071632 RepID=UPI003F38FB8D
MVKYLEIKELFGEKNLEIFFKDGINILIGKNGTGKTTILEIIDSLVNLKIERLSKIEFKTILLEMQDVKFTAEKTKNKLVLKIEGLKSDEKIIEKKFNIIEESKNFYKIEEDEFGDERRVYYREFSSENRKNILQLKIFLAAIKKQEVHYLTLNRQGVASAAVLRRERLRIGEKNDVFGLDEVEKTIKVEYSNILRHYETYNNEFKKQVLLTPFSVDKKSDLKSSVEKVLKFDKNIEKQIEEAFLSLEIPQESYNSLVGEYFKTLYEKKKELEKLDIETVLTSPIANEEEFELLLFSLDNIKLEYAYHIIEKAKEIKEKKKKIYTKIEKLTVIVNKFYSEIGKKIRVNDVGGLDIRNVKNEEKKINLEKLSSGEKQILTLFTFLIFNTKETSGGIFIMDEPELSLHIDWQEKISDSLNGVSELNQYIIATHSPEVIGNYGERCIEIGEYNVIE